MVKWLRKRLIEKEVDYVQKVYEIKRNYYKDIMSHMRVEDTAIFKDENTSIYAKMDENFKNGTMVADEDSKEAKKWGI